MKKLTNEQIIEICDNVIESVKEAERKGYNIYLCETTVKEIRKINNKQIIKLDVTGYIPEFTNENARKHTNARGYYVWWRTYDNNNEFNYSDRIKFMEWIKSQYQNK